MNFRQVQVVQMWPQASAQPEVRAGVLSVLGLTLPLPLAAGGVASANWLGKLSSACRFSRATWAVVRRACELKCQLPESTNVLAEACRSYRASQISENKQELLLGRCREMQLVFGQGPVSEVLPPRGHFALMLPEEVSQAGKSQTCCSRGLCKRLKLTERPPPDLPKVRIILWPNANMWAITVSPQPCTQATRSDHGFG